MRACARAHTADTKFPGQSMAGVHVTNRKEFEKKLRSLELTVSNDTKAATLTFAGEHFDSGTWFEHLSASVIGPNQASKGFVSNRESAPTGVTGGLTFKIEQKNRKDKYLRIGFTNPFLGSFKTYIGIGGSPGAKLGYENAEDDSHKLRVLDEYKVEAVLTAAQEGGDKQMIFTISDSK